MSETPIIMPFSRKTKTEIWKRSEGYSEVTGKNTLPMHCSHKNHSKKSEDYDNPENGLLLRIDEHLFHHLSYRHLFETDPEEAMSQLGLNRRQNEWAIARLFEAWQHWQNRHGEG